MQTDWGGEYQKLHPFFAQVGITHHISCPHTHQQNGAVERKHRHIVEVGLALLAHANMPLKFWPDAFLSATHLINRTPSRLLSYDTPLFRLFNQQPDYSSLRVFGCACWPNLRPYNTHKLQFRSKQCTFLGYSPFHKGFKCLDPDSGRVYISRDVTFDESLFPFQFLHSNAGRRFQDEINLLPTYLLNPTSGVSSISDHVTDSSINPANNAFPVHEIVQELASSHADPQGDSPVSPMTLASVSAQESEPGLSSHDTLPGPTTTSLTHVGDPTSSAPNRALDSELPTAVSTPDPVLESSTTPSAGGRTLSKAEDSFTKWYSQGEALHRWYS